MMDRRTFITVMAGILAAPQIARAQGTQHKRRIGLLSAATVDPPGTTLRILRPVWQRLGYAEGESVLLRSAEGDPLRMPGLVEELIELGAEVLIVVAPQAVRAARQVTSTTPIVAIDLETDPVKSGFAQSFARPGGNITGLFLDQPGLTGKWLQLLREAAPHIVRA